jgi:C1A family cysteine protease
MIQQTARYGWKKDSLDHRDLILPPRTTVIELPTLANLQKINPPIYNQYQAGACTGNGIARAVDVERKIQGLPFITPSRLFIYWNERVVEGTTSQDAGAEPRDGIKSVASLGVCPEDLWPYTLNYDQIPTLLYEKPGSNAFAAALKFKALKYQRVTQTAIDVKSVLAIMGRPFIFGFSVFEAFESDEVAATGIVPMPLGMDTPIGGHCVVCVGYSDATSRFLCANSWGAEWGLKGYFELPYPYLLNPNLASDLWVITSEEATMNQA